MIASYWPSGIDAAISECSSSKVRYTEICTEAEFGIVSGCDVTNVTSCPRPVAATAIWALRSAGEDIRQAADAVDRRLRVSGRHQDSHTEIIHQGRARSFDPTRLVGCRRHASYQFVLSRISAKL